MGGHIHNLKPIPLYSLMIILDFSLLHFITKWNVSCLWFLTPHATNIQSASLFILLDVYHFLFFLFPSKKLKRRENSSFPGTTCLATHHLAFFSFSSPSSSGKIQLLLLHWLFHLCSPTFPIFQFLLPASLLLYSLFFSLQEILFYILATSYSRRYLWSLLRLSDAQDVKYEDIPWVFSQLCT